MTNFQLTFYYKKHLYIHRIRLELQNHGTVLIWTLCQRIVGCSVDVGPDRHGNEYLNRALQEHYVLKQAVNLW